MVRARHLIVAAAAIVAVSSSTSAFAQTKSKDKTEKTEKTTKTKTMTQAESAEQARKAKEQEEEMQRARASTTTVTSAEPQPPSMPAPGAEKEGIRVNWPIMLTGAVVFAAAYVPSLTVGIIGRDDERAMIAPVVGPWIALGQKDCNEEPCSNEGLDKTLMVTSGILQGAGLLAMTLSVFIPPPSGSSVPGMAAAKPTVRFTPVSFGRSGAGVGAVGTF